MKKIKFFILTKTIGLYLNIASYFDLKWATNKAYQLFSHPRKGKINIEKMPVTLQNVTLESFECQNEKFQTYIWQGTRGAAERSEANEDVILLVHGWESNASRWKKLLDHLKPLGKTIIAIDGPAHGLSEGSEFSTPKYAACIDVLTQKYQPKIVIGHSVGGATIAFYLNKYKNTTIEKVILLGAPSDFKILNDGFITLLSLNSKIKRALEQYYQEKFKIDITDFCCHKFAENFTQSAFVAHDKLDAVVLVDEGRKYASTWKNSKYIETSGIGHNMHDSDLYEKITSFIKEPTLSK